MDYELKATPTQSRAFTSAHRSIVYFWIFLWATLMLWLFIDINSQSGGWFDGPLFAAMMAGYGLVVGLVALTVVVGVIRLAIKDKTLRTLFLLIFPLGLLVWVFVAFSA
jgi:hypothetical protein